MSAFSKIADKLLFRFVSLPEKSGSTSLPQLFDTLKTLEKQKLTLNSNWSFSIALNLKLKVKLLFHFSPSEEDCRPQEDMAELLHKSLHLGPSLDVTTG
jgi:hypothetical protein